MCGGVGVCVFGCVGKPNLVKDFCTRLPLDLDLDFVLGLGQAFQQYVIDMNGTLFSIKGT